MQPNAFPNAFHKWRFFFSRRKTNEVAHKRRKDNDDAGNDSVVSEHEQPKPKKLKSEKPQVENEITEAAELVKGKENPEKKKKKKKKKKKNLAGTTVATVSNLPVITTQAVSPSQESKMKINSTGKKSETTSSTENSPKKKTKKKPIEKLSAQEEDQKTGSSSVNEGKKKKKKKKKSKNGTETTTNKKSATIRGFDITDDRLKAYGIRNPKKFKNAIIFRNLKK